MDYREAGPIVHQGQLAVNSWVRQNVVTDMPQTRQIGLYWPNVDGSGSMTAFSRTVNSS